MRRLDRAVALVVGLVLAAAAVVTGIEAVLLAAGEPALWLPRTTWGRDLAGLGWDNATLQGVAVGVAAAGVVLLVAQVLPRRPLRLLVSSGTRAGTWVSRKGFGRKIVYDVTRLPAVDAAAARISGRRVRVRATLAPGVGEALGAQGVREATDAVLAQWPLAAPLRVKVTVKATRPRTAVRGNAS